MYRAFEDPLYWCPDVIRAYHCRIREGPECPTKYWGLGKRNASRLLTKLYVEAMEKPDSLRKVLDEAKHYCEEYFPDRYDTLDS